MLYCVFAAADDDDDGSARVVMMVVGNITTTIVIILIIMRVIEEGPLFRWETCSPPAAVGLTGTRDLDTTFAVLEVKL